MKMKTRLKIIGASLLMMAAGMPMGAQVITFEGPDQPQVGVWDAWEKSPFRTGLLQGNCRVVTNPLADDGNPSEHVLGCQRSLYGSNMYGARVDLPPQMQVELTPEEQYLHVSIHKPVAGRCLLVVLGRHEEPGWQHQGTDVVQSTRLSLNEAAPGRWTDVVFPMKGAGGVRASSIVIVFDCESPHRLAEPFVAYMDNIRLGDAVPQETAGADAGSADESGTVLVTNSQRNGEVLLPDGQPFNAGYRHPRGTPLCVKGVGEEGFVCTAVIVRYGPGGTLSRRFAREEFQPDGTLVIPGELITGDILIEGVMTERK
ncbi:MAG: hypothetical protein ACI4B5_05265 [Bacteroidaceae bacterium]